MKAIVVIGAFVLVTATTVSGFADESLLFETWAESYFNPGRVDDFIQVHGTQYTDEYFKCSREAQQLIREESRLRDRQCDFAPDSGVRSRCRKDNQFRGLDRHLAELDQAIRSRTAWLDVESGRNASTAVRAAEEFEKSCTPAACDIAKRKKSELLRDLKPYLQCPPHAERPDVVDPKFKNFEPPSDLLGG